MTHITHFRLQPANIHYWDYYILCRLNTEAAIALQRMEFWDGTKEDGNVHAENINDAMEHQGKTPTQDTSRWIYKSADELHWELMGVSGERRLPALLNFLIKDLKYLESRHHPTKGWDRRMQYQFRGKQIQEHINYLGYIISYFGLSIHRLCPVFYAIELLTSEKCYIEDLNAEKVLAKIESLKSAEKLPHFLKSAIEKFTQSFVNPPVRSFCNFAEWKLHSCGMHGAEMQNASGKTAESIPQNCGSNNILHFIRDNIEDIQEDTYGDDVASANHHDTPASSLEEKIAALQQQIETLRSQATERLSTSDVHNTPETVENVEPTRQADIPTEENKQTELPIASTTPHEVSEHLPVEEKPKKQQRQRKPKVDDPVTEERVDKVLEYFNQLLREVTSNPEAKYASTKAARTDIKEILLPCNPTEKKLRTIYLTLWNAPRDQRSGFKWSENMTIKAICKQYESKAIALMAEEQKETEKQKAKQAMNAVIINPALIAQEEDDLKFDINRYRRSSHPQRGRRSAS